MRWNFASLHYTSNKGGSRLLHGALVIVLCSNIDNIYIQGQKVGRWPPSFPLIVTKSLAAWGVFWTLIKQFYWLCPLRRLPLFVESWTAADRKGVGRVGLAVNEGCVLKSLRARRGKHEAACRWITSGLRPADQRLGFAKESIFTRSGFAKHAQPWKFTSCLFL